MAETERALAGGNSAAGVVRVGDTVRKPWLEGTPAVIEFMARVREAGVDVPAVLGRDEQGRQIIEFVEGRLALDLPPLSTGDLARVGSIVREIHDASEGFVPAAAARWECPIASPGDDLICHGDLAPWNLIVGDRWVFIDWDGASPSTRLWDLAYATQTFTLNDPTVQLAEAVERLVAFVAGYGPDVQLRAALAATMTERAAAMYELLRSSSLAGVEPWATMFVGGHGERSSGVLRYLERNQDLWNHALTSDTPGAATGDSELNDDVGGRGGRAPGRRLH